MVYDFKSLSSFTEFRYVKLLITTKEVKVLYFTYKYIITDYNLCITVFVSILKSRSDTSKVTLDLFKHFFFS